MLLKSELKSLIGLFDPEKLYRYLANNKPKYSLLKYDDYLKDLLLSFTIKTKPQNLNLMIFKLVQIIALLRPHVTPEIKSETISHLTFLDLDHPRERASYEIRFNLSNAATLYSIYWSNWRNQVNLELAIHFHTDLSKLIQGYLSLPDDTRLLNLPIQYEATNTEEKTQEIAYDKLVCIRKVLPTVPEITLFHSRDLQNLDTYPIERPRGIYINQLP